MENNKTKNPEQIIRCEGSGVFFEIMNSMFDKGKVLINFDQYDTNTYKRIREIPIYIEISKFLQLCNDVQLHFIERKILEEKKKINGTNNYPAPVWTDMGGTTKENLEKYNRSRADGKDESRVFKIMPATRSNTAHVIFQAERGAGEKTPEGLIAPKFNYKDTNSYERIMVQLTFDQLVAVCTAFMIEYQGYITSQYVAGKKVYIRNT